MKLFITLLFSCTIFIFTNAQDSTQVKEKNAKLILSLDFRSTFTNSYTVKIKGGKIGINYGLRHRFGIGYYWTIFKTPTQTKETRIPSLDTTVRANVDIYRKFNFFTLFYEYSFFHTKKFEVNMFGELGYGNATITRNLVYSKSSKTVNRKLFPLGIGFTTLYRLPKFKNFPYLSWFGLNAMIGYRNTTLISLNSDDISDYNGLFWAYKIVLFPGNILADYKEKRRQK